MCCYLFYNSNNKSPDALQQLGTTLPAYDLVITTVVYHSFDPIKIPDSVGCLSLFRISYLQQLHNQSLQRFRKAHQE